MADNKRVLTFHSDAVEDDTLHITELSGLDEISRYYVFTLDLVSKKADINFADMLKKPARIEIKQGVKLAGGDKRGQQTLKIHGYLRSFEQVEQRADWVRYRAELVPPLWKLSMNYQSRIFMEKDVPEIVKDVLMGHGLSEGTDFELRNLSGYPKREFVMQYEESDLDFMDRWLEHEGIFYFFEHSDQGSKLVLGNATAAHKDMQGTPKIAYNPLTDTDNRAEAGDSDKASDDWFREEVIPIFHCTQKVIPKKVILKEYNWRKPTDELKVEHKVSDDGIGSVYEYNNHYKDTSEGDKLAEVRAQEHLCREIVYSGESDCKSFRAGATYTLEKHFRGDFNKSHLITAVSHSASQSVELASNTTVDAKYRNRFTSIPADRVFRPLRITKWPQISGFMSAKVDASGNGQYAEIDDMGRYKVKLPLDMSDKKDGKASRYIRMAQPYAGANMGMHFPLHKGTEVLLTFKDGDPDRPVIVNSVPNPDTSSPVTGSNQSQCKIQTGGGNKITIEDEDGNQRIKMECPHSNTFIQMGSKNDPHQGVSIGTGSDMTERVGGNTDHETQGTSTSHVIGATIMNFDATHQMKVMADATWNFLANVSRTIGGKLNDTITGKNHKTIIGGSTEIIIGGKIGLISPYKQEVVGGASVSNIMGAKAESIWGAKVEVVKGAVVSLKNVKTMEWTPQKDKKMSIVKDTFGLLKGAYGAYKAKVAGETAIKSADKFLAEAAKIKNVAASLLECKSPELKLLGENMKLKADQMEASGNFFKCNAEAKMKKAMDVKNGTFTVK